MRMTSNFSAGRSCQDCSRNVASGARARAFAMNPGSWSIPRTRVAPRFSASRQKNPSLQPKSRKLLPDSSLGNWIASSFAAESEEPLASNV